MKFLPLLFAAIALANPIALPLLAPRQESGSGDCAETCKKTYTHCYNFCNSQQILNPAPCARLCNVRGCKEESCKNCEAFASEHCMDLPAEE